MNDSLMNKFHWDLASIYDSPNDPRLNYDILLSRKIIDSLINIFSTTKSLSPSELFEVLNDYEMASLYTNKLSSYILLSTLADCNTQSIKMYSAKVDDLGVNLKLVSVKIEAFLQGISNLDMYLDQFIPLNYYRDYLKEKVRVSGVYASTEIEDIINKLQLSGSKSWQRLRDTIESSTTITSDLLGENNDYNLTELRNLATSGCKDIRKKAYLCEIELCKSIELPISYCINSLKGEGITATRLRGYGSVLEWMLDINKMSLETLELMISKIEYYLPDFQNHIKSRALILGYEDSLPWFELSAPLATSPSTLSIDEFTPVLLDIFKDFDEEMGAFYEHVIDNRWVDYYPRKNKAGGAMCVDIALISENRIHLNFNGTTSGLRLLAHELGHAYHSRCLDELPFIHRDPPTPICETASIFSEIVLQEGLWGLLDNDLKKDLIDTSTREITSTILDIYSRYVFEKELFDRRKDHELTSSELCEIMSNAQIQVYGSSIDKDCLHPYMWIPKVHYYIPDFHFYNFPYIFGLLLSKGLYANYRKDKIGFISRYKLLLQSSCTGTIEEILADSGFDVTTPEFWDEAFKELINDLHTFDGLTKKIK